jgi:hypothetical protein
MADNDKSARRRDFEQIQDLVEQGILGRELLPEPDYWHWQILDETRLPDNLRHFIPIGEVRW